MTRSAEGREDRSRAGDRRLVRRMLAGDEAAFEEFCEGHVPVVYRFVHRRLRGDRELAREIVQATVCKAIAGLDRFHGRASLSTWLCACARNEIAMHFRRRGRRPREVELDEQTLIAGSASGPFGSVRPMVVGGEDGPELALLRKESAELVHVALDELPPRYGRALEWKYLERLPVREIAGRMGLGTKAAESLLTRARHAFREAYERLAAATAAPSPGMARSLPRTAVER